jgi:spoIIIJ-associated protein
MSEINKINFDKEKISEIIKKMISFMNIDCEVEINKDVNNIQGNSVIIASIRTSENASFLIGKNGQTLKALEHIARIILSKTIKDTPIILDVNNYRKSKISYLIEVAKQAVARVRNTQKAEALFPMSAYERRIVHMELATYPDIATESIGTEPQRRVVIKPYP